MRFAVRTLHVVEKDILEFYPNVNRVALALRADERQHAHSFWELASGFEPAYAIAGTKRDYAIAAPKNAGKDANPWQRTSTSS